MRCRLWALVVFNRQVSSKNILHVTACTPYDESRSNWEVVVLAGRGAHQVAVTMGPKRGRDGPWCSSLPEACGRRVSGGGEAEVTSPSMWAVLALVFVVVVVVVCCCVF